MFVKKRRSSEMLFDTFVMFLLVMLVFVMAWAIVLIWTDRSDASEFVETPDISFTKAVIDYHAHAILTFQQAEREQAWIEHQKEHQRQDALKAAALVAEKQSTVISTSSSKVVSSPTSTGTGRWDSLAQCESGGNWAANTGNGYYGGIQWAANSWRAWRTPSDPDFAHLASREQQIAAGERYRTAEISQGRGGYGPWPACARKLGLPR